VLCSKNKQKWKFGHGKKFNKNIAKKKEKMTYLLEKVLPPD
jgi:hypothetical protein